MQFPCVTALCPRVTAFESSMPPERIVLVLVPVLSAALLVLDFDERVSWFENGSPR